ncbi:uncharacterized protein LOC114874348 [Osmia bicornis bicornis]|uniref:uncharacterized protein LOC114874348 n=1 Tax=Osmia bicornis bicornis TaxID=1437191 RepID=UPI001EAF2B79|nr:uncharacterized protein LOC114874348 [Osmia bicornis bicornis]
MQGGMAPHSYFPALDADYGRYSESQLISKLDCSPAEGAESENRVDNHEQINVSSAETDNGAQNTQVLLSTNDLIKLVMEQKKHLNHKFQKGGEEIEIFQRRKRRKRTFWKEQSNNYI